MILTLHTFGEYLDFHPQIHALVADGLFVRDAPTHATHADPRRYGVVLTLVG